jgi:ferrous iron transport protein A
MTPGRSFRVRRISAEGEIRQRLVDMGFVRGAEGRILREALLRDPIEVEMKGSLLSLRRVEATGIQVEELNV